MHAATRAGASIARRRSACAATFALLAGLFVGAGCAAPDAVDLGPRVSSARGVVVSDAPLASRVGAEVLADGGNAVDAAVATAFALAVVYPTAGNLGGGGFLVARAAGRSWALDFRETAPAAASRDMYAAAGVAADASLTGDLACGVPGSVAGLFEAHARLGSLPWPRLLAPAIALAEDGFTLDEAFVKDLPGERPRLQRFAASAALLPPARVGDRWRNPDLAAVLRRIAERGPEGFYGGATADAIVAEMARGGGLITRADLAGYRAVWREPLEFSYRGARVCSMPPPSSGGVSLELLCHLLEPYDLRALGWQSPAALHLQAEASRRAFAARNACLGDPDFVRNPLEELLSPAWADSQRASIRTDRATPSRDIDPGVQAGARVRPGADASAAGAPVMPGAGASSAAPRTPRGATRFGSDGSEAQHTTHLSVIDARGEAVALTTTLNGAFGSAVVVPGAGFLLNNQMDDFATRPGAPNGYGLVQGEANAIAPGKRMLSSMTPTIVRDTEDRVLLVTGAAGGPRIISATFGIVSAVLDFGADVAAAVAAPRSHHQHLPDELMVEASDAAAAVARFPESTLAALSALGHTLKRVKSMADASTIGRDLADPSRWLGVAEPRAHGAAAGVR